MKIKRYLDKDMRNVLARVRKDQGPDAVILSNRRVEDGIEVIAAIDYDEALVRHAIGMDTATPETNDTRISSDALARIAEDAFIRDEVTEAKDVVPGEEATPDVISADIEAQPSVSFNDELNAQRADRHGDDDRLTDVQEEIASLRGLLETQLSGLVWKETAQGSPLRAQMLRNLARLGITPDIANQVVDRLEPVNEVRRLWHAPLTELTQLLPVKTDKLLEQGGTFALIGPTGVGKTTTIAKIAAQFAMLHGADEIALVSADSYRIGAKEHLMAFANIIGAKVYAASSSDELTRLLMQLGRKKLVLIDTEGRSPRDRELAGRLAAYGNNQERVKFYLTLSAATQEAALDEAIREFGSRVPLEGAILTKIDEAGQLGCAISALIRNDLPACWFANGQHIPDDLYLAGRKKLWLVNQAVECLEYAEPRLDERTMAEQFTSAANA